MKDKRKPNWSVLLVIGLAHLAVTSWTWRGIRRRPAEQVRGSKTLWRLISAVNTLGSAGYWLLGRRRGRSSAVEQSG